MTVRLHEDQVPTCTDVDLLWEEFLAARAADDTPRAEILKTRMAQLQEQQSASAMDDDHLLAEIASLEQQRVAAADDPTVAPIDETRLGTLVKEADRRDL